MAKAQVIIGVRKIDFRMDIDRKTGERDECDEPKPTVSWRDRERNRRATAAYYQRKKEELLQRKREKHAARKAAV